MAVAKKEKKEPSCPLWLATYGDMVTNMLVFFVLLLSMSEIKKEERFVEFMQAIQEAFGYIGGMEQMPVEEKLDVKNVPLAQMIIVPIDPHDLSKSPDQGVVGKHRTVTRPRPPERYDRGGKFQFTELDAALSEAEQARVAQYAEQLRGLRTQVEVRGHCSRRPVDDTEFPDHFALAFERARVVKNALVAAGIDEQRIVIVAAGTNEPVTTGNYTSPERQGNDIVEVLQVNKRVDEFGDATEAEEPEAASDPQP